MHLPAHEFLKPASLAECLAVLGNAAGEVKPVAGGTDVVFNMRGRLFQPDVLLSLRGLAELQGLAALPDGGLRIGAGTRLSELEREPALAAFPALQRACRAVASRHIRNMATLGGNLCLDTRCWYTNQTAEWRQARGPCLKNGVNACHAIKRSAVCVALNASDIAPALIALGARVRLAEFYTSDGVRHTRRRADELLVAVDLPAAPRWSGFIKETARKGNDFSYGVIAGAAQFEAGRPVALRLVLGSLVSRPVLLERAAALIIAEGFGAPVIERAAEIAREELGPLTNLYTPAAYKGSLARSLLRRLLAELEERLA